MNPQSYDSVYNRCVKLQSCCPREACGQHQPDKQKIHCSRVRVRFHRHLSSPGPYAELYSISVVSTLFTLTLGVCWHVTIHSSCRWDVNGKKKKKRKSGRQPSYDPCTSWAHLKLAMRKAFWGEDIQRAYSTFTQRRCACKCAWSDNFKNIDTFFSLLFLVPLGPGVRGMKK